jgi:hypothetical protein
LFIFHEIIHQSRNLVVVAQRLEMLGFLAKEVGCRGLEFGIGAREAELLDYTGLLVRVFGIDRFPGSAKSTLT